MVFHQYISLMRLNKPIGISLLLWPTMWALWLASEGVPDARIFFIFFTGVVLMRSAGCVVNDIFDRHFDGHVSRTRDRPLASGTVSVEHAVILAAMLGLASFILVLFCNLQTILLACAGAVLAIVYPLLKRVTHLPQFGLGIAFSWGIPMVFAAVTGSVPASAWLLFATAAVWPVIYDTMYAMTDREDDLMVGVKSTAILFGRYDVALTGCFIIIFLALLTAAGISFQLHASYYFAIFAAAILFLRQLKLIRTYEPRLCFQAFLENNWIGMIIFAGIFLSEWN